MWSEEQGAGSVAGNPTDPAKDDAYGAGAGAGAGEDTNPYVSTVDAPAGRPPGARWSRRPKRPGPSGGPLPTATAAAAATVRDRLGLRVPAAVAAVVLGCDALLAVTGLGGGASPRTAQASPAIPRAVTALAGQVLVLEPTGRLYLTRPDARRLRSVGAAAVRSGAVGIALDGRLAVAGGGSVLTVGSGSVRTSPLQLRLPDGAELALPDPFADGNRAVTAVGAQAADGNAPIMLVDLSRGSTRTLGQGDPTTAAGDPQAVGVFASVPAQAGTYHVGAKPVAPIDSGVELLSAGRPPRILASFSDLNTVADLDANTPVHLNLYPDPTGQQIAVVVNPPGGGGATSAIVVIDRSGRRVGFVAYGPGSPTAYVAPAWSPDGRSLAYPTLTGSGAALAIWDVVQPPQMRAAPSLGLSAGRCVWAPDGQAVICPSEPGPDANWVVAHREGPVYRVPAAGTPLAWMPLR